jgi:hypothetical protein
MARSVPLPSASQNPKQHSTWRPPGRSLALAAHAHARYQQVLANPKSVAASGLAYWICFCFGHPRREAGARRVLAQATVAVATAALGPTQRPHETIWAPIGYESVQLRLAELAGVPISPESGERIAETQVPATGGRAMAGGVAREVLVTQGRLAVRPR